MIFNRHCKHAIGVCQMLAQRNEFDFIGFIVEIRDDEDETIRRDRFGRSAVINQRTGTWYAEFDIVHALD